MTLLVLGALVTVLTAASDLHHILTGGASIGSSGRPRGLARRYDYLGVDGLADRLRT